ncbi:hypothetical protein [Chryseobacterium shigense]|uniref:Uncharacterized protein n=1 Tax=Chryseobacterium shigense TaxID=297244 RepID=A0A841MW31_9FLAO|nr:hypothetical protein [Chryseobacterium shigense]MBB6369166.1 hypothetical protein [Chryseobacterium shigense]
MAGVDFRTTTQTQRRLLSRYFVRGWWTDVNDMEITEASYGDTVKFHLQTQSIPNDRDVILKLFDDDTVLNTSEDQEDDQVGLVYSESGRPALQDRIDLNKKIIKTITLDNLELFAKNENDGILELYFKCSYDNEVDIKFPDMPTNYLKVIGTPKILLVNGHWNRAAHAMGMSPGSGGEGYWDFFTRDVKRYKNSADQYFGIKSKEPLYVDGSSSWGGSESGSERKTRGYDYCKENFNEIKKGLGKEKIYLISHSEGGAHAAGICKYLSEQGIEIGESLMLSADEGDEFSVEGNYPCYQIVAGYLSKDWLTRKTIFHIDPVVMDNKVQGVNRYGVYISNGGFGTVHGITIGESTFGLVSKLKNIVVIPALNSRGGSVHQTSPMDEDWYRIDDYVLYNKKIDLYPRLNSNISEAYYQRQD